MDLFHSRKFLGLPSNFLTMLEIPCVLALELHLLTLPVNFEKPAQQDLFALEVEVDPELMAVVELMPDHRPFLINLKLKH